MTEKINEECRNNRFNSMEREAAKIATLMHPDRDYNVSFTREGTTLVMTIVEKPGGNIPAEPELKHHGVPEDILAMLAGNGGELDDLVHEAKGHEASAINNGGALEQLDYLRSSNWAGWDEIRRFLRPGEYCPSCNTKHTEACIDGGRCTSCGVMLCGVMPKDKKEAAGGE